MSKAKKKKAAVSQPPHLQGVRNVIEGEGFDYAFVHYSSFKDVKDERFHALRKEFLSAREALNKYIGTNPND